MTEHNDLLAVEKDEGADRLAAAEGPDVSGDNRVPTVHLGEDDGAVYDPIQDAVADLALCLHRLERQRHQVADRFAEEVSMSEPGVIHDIGYQRCTRRRLSSGYSARSLNVHSLRSAHGIGRGPWAKVLPIGLVTRGASSGTRPTSAVSLSAQQTTGTTPRINGWRTRNRD